MVRMVHSNGRHSLLSSLEVVEENGALLGLLAPVTDNDAGAVDYFTGVAFAVDLACSQVISQVANRDKSPYPYP